MRSLGFLDFANFSAATAMHTSEDWRLGTTLNLAEEERLWIEQSGTLAGTKVTESRHWHSRFLQTGGF